MKITVRPKLSEVMEAKGWKQVPLSEASVRKAVLADSIRTKGISTGAFSQ